MNIAIFSRLLIFLHVEPVLSSFNLGSEWYIPVRLVLHRVLDLFNLGLQMVRVNRVHILVVYCNQEATMCCFIASFVEGFLCLVCGGPLNKVVEKLVVERPGLTVNQFGLLCIYEPSTPRLNWTTLATSF